MLATTAESRRVFRVGEVFRNQSMMWLIQKYPIRLRRP